LGVLYLAQWGYLGWVGLDSGLWDLSYTRAEKLVEARPAAVFRPEVVSAFEESVRKAQALSPEDGRLARSYHDYGTVLWLNGRRREGQLYLEQALVIFERVDGPNSTWVGVVEQRLGELEIARGDFQAGLGRLRKAETILLRTLGHLEPLSLRVRTLVAKYERDASKARAIFDDYQKFGLPLEPMARLELENLMRTSP
jgi:hypothetical protein